MSIRFVTLPARRLPQMPQLWAIGRCPRDDRRSNAAGTPLDERRLDDREVGMVSYTLELLLAWSNAFIPSPSSVLSLHPPSATGEPKPAQRTVRCLRSSTVTFRDAVGAVGRTAGRASAQVGARHGAGAEGESSLWSPSLPTTRRGKQGTHRCQLRRVRARASATPSMLVDHPLQPSASRVAHGVPDSPRRRVSGRNLDRSRASEGVGPREAHKKSARRGHRGGPLDSPMDCCRCGGCTTCAHASRRDHRMASGLACERRACPRQVSRHSCASSRWPPQSRIPATRATVLWRHACTLSREPPAHKRWCLPVPSWSSWR